MLENFLNTVYCQGYDAIITNRAKICVVGGYDDFGEEGIFFSRMERLIEIVWLGSYEFAQMRATSSAAKEMAAGREPTEMSRPTTTSRGGFMEV